MVQGTEHGFSQRQPSSAEKVREHSGVLPEVPGLSSAIHLRQAIHPDTHQQRFKYQLREICAARLRLQRWAALSGKCAVCPHGDGRHPPDTKACGAGRILYKDLHRRRSGGSGYLRWLRHSAVAALKRAAALSALKTPRPFTAPPPSALSRHGWLWSVAGKECNYRRVFHHLCRSPVALLPKGLAGGGGASLPHHEY